MKLKSPDDLAVAVLKSKQVESSLSVALAVLDGFKIASREDMEQAGDSARLIKRGVAALTDELRDAFQPFKAFEAQVRGMVEIRAGAKLKAALERIDAERRRWALEEARLAREQAIREQAEADAAARAAREAATSGTFADDEEAPPAAQAVTHLPERTVRGAVATTAQVRKVEAVELVNPTEAAEAWGAEIVTLNARMAGQRYMDKVKAGLLLLPPDGAEHVVGGVKFVTRISFSDRARGGA